MVASLVKGRDYEDFEFVYLENLTGLIPAVYDEMPHLVFVEVRLSNIAGFNICQSLKQDVLLQHIPLIMMTQSDGKKDLMDCCADVYLRKKEPAATVMGHIRELLGAVRHELDVNPLTRLPGSRSTVEEIYQTLVKDMPLALCAIRFKNLESFYKKAGPQRGDALVRRSVELMRELAAESGPKTQYLGHLGSRDFAALVASEQACEIAERLIERFDLGLGGLTASEDGQDLKEASPQVYMTIAIVGLDGRSFAHMSEIAKVCDEIQDYLTRFERSAYLENRRLSLREKSGEVPFTKNLDDERPLWDELVLQKARGVNHSLFAEVVQTIKKRSVETHFQPIVDFEGKVYAYEALSRFKRDDGTFIEPIRMFQASREANLIKEFDILCALVAIQSSEQLPKEAKIFLNLNRETLIDPGALAQLIRGPLVDPSRLVLELTEQSFLRKVKQVMHAIQEIRKRGCRVALDDTGGGSVSLREAAEMRPDFVKFDRSCIHEIADSDIKQKILNSLLTFAQSIGSRTVGEGIERPEDLLYLKQIGIDFAQGYLIGRPSAQPASVFHLPV